MKIKICLLTLILAAFGLFPNLNAEAQQRGIERCKVSDPSGLMLNVRSLPNGRKIVSKLKNGTSIFIEEYGADMQDGEWVKVRLTGKRVNKALGWVIRENLNCE